MPGWGAGSEVAVRKGRAGHVAVVCEGTGCMSLDCMRGVARFLENEHIASRASMAVAPDASSYRSWSSLFWGQVPCPWIVCEV